MNYLQLKFHPPYVGSYCIVGLGSRKYGTKKLLSIIKISMHETGSVNGGIGDFEVEYRLLTYAQKEE
jgi:hypothetical protein